MKSRTSMRLIATVLICTWLPSVAAWGAVVTPPVGLLPLNQIPVPEPPNLFQFVKNKPVAIRLGKALFWDMQAGSNGFQACGSCHFSAGADNRLKNTVNPGTRGGDTTFQVRGPNEVLDPVNDFPFFKLLQPDFPGIPLRQINDIVGSQGVHLTQFNGIVPGSAVDDGTSIPDPVFQANGVNMRRVTARNTPTNINAVFNFNNFWDGRAHAVFNGANPFGPLDPSAGVWFNTGTAQSPVLQKKPVVIDFASLASQATGPPLDDTEMSYRGRTFPELGRKMLGLTPLGKQLVHPNDSVLGSLSKAVLANGKYSGNGLNTSYGQMIQDAFQDNLWNATSTVSLPATINGVATTGNFTQMEANFSLFWGLAIQLYEATLVADETPYDRFLGGDKTALTSQQQDGFNVFFGTGCNACHLGTELTSASVTSAAFLNNNTHALIEAMVVGTVTPAPQIIYDNGFNNTAVRPTTEDIGRGGDSPFTNPLTTLPFPLSYSKLAELQATGSLGFNPFLFPPGQPVTPILIPANIASNFPVANDGNFKVPGLRNVELTAPYFHNGGDMTLADVVEFYARGGNFPASNQASLDPAIIQQITLQNNPTNQAALVAFMMSMTDERVRNQSAPFDHPELFIPNGDPDIIHIPAKDALGNAAPTIALTIDPVITPTNRTSQVISGTNDPGATVAISVNGGAAFPAAANSTSTWSTTVNGLVTGNNSIAATATLANVTTTLTANISVDTTAPLLTLSAVTTPTASKTQTISGTVEAGITPLISVDTTATVGPVTVGGGNWSAQISSLATGANFIVVAAVDSAGNFTTRTTTITYSTTMTIGDALRALRITTSLVQATPADYLLLDVAPLVNGVPAPNGSIDIADALLILKKVVGAITF